MTNCPIYDKFQTNYSSRLRSPKLRQNQKEVSSLEEKKFKVSAHIRIKSEKQAGLNIASPMETKIDDYIQPINRLFQHVKAGFEAKFNGIKVAEVTNIRISQNQEGQYALSAHLFVQISELFTCTIDKEAGDQRFGLGQLFEQLEEAAKLLHPDFEEIVYLRILPINKLGESTGIKF